MNELHRYNAVCHFGRRLRQRFNIPSNNPESLQKRFEMSIADDKPLRAVKDGKWLFRVRYNGKSIGAVFCPVLNCFVTAIYLKKREW